MIAALPLVSSILTGGSVADAIGPARTAAAAVAHAAAVPTQDFGQMLSQVASDALGSMKSAEKLSVSGLQGNANVQQVVQSVMTAQENLQTALAVRDKAVAAFQEVTRMSI